MPNKLAVNIKREVALATAIAQAIALIDSQPFQASQMILALIERVGNGELAANAALLGNLHCKLGNCRIVLHDPVGIRDFESALEFADQCGDLALKTDVLHHLARTFITFGDTHSALQYCERALDESKKLDDQAMFVQILMTLGLAFALTSQFQRSLDIYAEAAQLCQASNDNAGLSRALNNWADALISSYEATLESKNPADERMLDDAIRYGRQALALAKECAYFRMQLLTIETLAHAMEARGMYAVALDELEAGMSKLSGHGFVKEELDVQVRLGALQLRLHQPAAAIARLQKARELAIELRNYPHMSDLLKTLSTAHEAAGDFVSALDSYKEFHAVTLKSRDQRAQISAQIFAAKLDLEKLQRETDTHKSRVSQLENFNRSLSMQAREDSLTGLPNRRALQEHMDRSLLERHGKITFALLDIDFFKLVNDTFSHVVGDEVLRQFGVLIRSCLRAGDMAARIGGEEFALVIDRTRGSRSIEACERIRKAIQAYEWSAIAPNLHITASFGVTHVKTADDLAHIMSRADSALYQAKRHGRNRIEKA